MQEILDKIEFLFEKYSLVRRVTTQPYLLSIARENINGYEYHPDDELVLETLMEHVGSLPVLATALFPYIEDPNVNLGDALTMLAIHDIGELITGDENVFTKKPGSNEAEYKAALTLLDPMYHPTLTDIHNKNSVSAKFAKAIDKITPDIFDYLAPPDVTIWRYKHFVGVEADKIIGLLIEYKRSHMLWNPFMTEFHAYLLERMALKLKL